MEDGEEFGGIGCEKRWVEIEETRRVGFKKAERGEEGRERVEGGERS